MKSGAEQETPVRDEPGITTQINTQRALLTWKIGRRIELYARQIAQHYPIFFIHLSTVPQ
jgi:hypothetical protein